MDILIKGGLIVDGTGEKPFYGDIAIDRDMITEIGEKRNYGYTDQRWSDR